MNKIKLSVAVALALILLIFCLQNMAIVEVKFLTLQMSISRAFLLLLVYGVGLISGMALFRTIWKVK